MSLDIKAILSKLSGSLETLDECGFKLEDHWHDDAIRTLQAHLDSASASEHSEQYPLAAISLARLLFIRNIWRHGHCKDDLEHAISILLGCPRLTRVPAQSQLPDCSESLLLSQCYQKRFVMQGGTENLDQALKWASYSLKSASDDTFRSRCLQNRAAVCSLYGLHHPADPDYMEKTTIQDLEEGLLISRSSKKDIHEFLLAAGASYLGLAQRATIVPDPTHLELALKYLKEAYTIWPVSECNPYRILNVLGQVYGVHHSRLHEISFLQKSVVYCREAIDHTPNKSMYLGRFHLDLSVSLYARYEVKSQFVDLDEAISHARKSVQICSEEVSFFTLAHSNLSVMLGKRHSITGDIENLKSAVDHAVEGLRHDPRGDASTYCNVSISLRSLFEVTRDLEHLHRAVEYAERALQVSFDFRGGGCVDHETPVYLNNLASMLRARFEENGDIADLHMALEYCRKATQIMTGTVQIHHSHPDQSLIQSTISLTLLRLFEVTGQALYIDEAILCAHNSVDMLSKGHHERCARMALLAHALVRRYEYLGKWEDAEQATKWARKAVKAVMPFDKRRAQFLLTLALSLRQLFLLRGVLSDLYEAVQVAQSALEELESNHRQYMLCVDGLCTLLRLRHMFLGQEEDIDDAIKLARECLQADSAIKSGDTERMILQRTLISALRQRGYPDDINLSIAMGNALLARTSDTTPLHPFLVLDAALSYAARYNQQKSREDWQKATNWYEIAVNDAKLPPSRRLDAAVVWCELAQEEEDWEMSLKAHVQTLDLLEVYVSLSHTRQDQQRRITSMCEGLGCNAAAVAIHEGQLELALQLLERGRALFWRRNAWLKEDFGSVRDSDVRSELQKISRETENLQSQISALNSLPIEAIHSSSTRFVEEAEYEMRRLSEEFDRLSREETQGYSLGGAQSEPISIDRLKSCSDKGPVVVVNISKYRCDALILRKDHDAVSIRLADITYDDLWMMSLELGERLQLGDRGYRSVRLEARLGLVLPEDEEDEEELLDVTLEKILHRLWMAIVVPILETLGFSKEDPIKRCWWCPTGPLATLPLHAAGTYASSTDSETGSKTFHGIMHHLTFSYIPTITSLVQSRERDQTLRRSESTSRQDEYKFLVVSVPDAPHFAPIPGTSSEARAVIETIKKNDSKAEVLHLHDKAATVDSVLSALVGDSDSYDSRSQASNPTSPSQGTTQRHWVHFASHGKQHNFNPLHSALYMSDGPLEMRQIIERSRRFTSPSSSDSSSQVVALEGAFLSACQTAVGLKHQSPDESFHLAGALMFSGFKTAVATMWAIGDGDAKEIAEGFYIRGGFREGMAAGCLGEAVGQLRAKCGGEEFWRWVPFIHIGE